MADSSSSSTTAQQQGYVIDPITAQYMVLDQAKGIYNACWLGVLVAVVIAVVLLSTPAQRRGVVFWIQCLAFLMAVVNALLVTLAVVYNLRQIFLPYNIDLFLTNLECAQKGFDVFTPLVSDSTLIFKVLAFYPPTLHPNRFRRLAPIVPLLVLAVARIATCTMETYFYYKLDRSSDTAPEKVNEYGYTYQRISLAEFSLQIAFCSYASAVLFRKLYQFTQRRRKSRSRTPALQRRLRLLIESLAMTFVLPVIVQIIALSAAASNRGDILFFASLTNVYLSALLSVLATTWSTIRLSRMHNAQYAWSATSNKSDDSNKTPPKDDRQQQLLQQQQKPIDDAEHVHGTTLLDNLFNDDDDDDVQRGQSSSVEMLSSYQQVHSGVRHDQRLPARDTSDWRTRGVLRP